MDYSLLANIKEQVQQLLGVLLSLLGALLLWLSIAIKKDLKKLKERVETHILKDLNDPSKDNLIQQEKERIDLTKELDSLKITNPTLFYQVVKQSLSLKNQRDPLASVKEGATNSL
jgi:hypothetical protein